MTTKAIGIQIKANLFEYPLENDNNHKKDVEA